MDVEFEYQPPALHVDSLDEVADPVERGGYIPDPAGGFRLHPLIVGDIERHKQELATLVTDHEARSAAQDATLARRRAQLRRTLVDAELRKTLEAAQVVALDHSIVVAAMTADLNPVLRELEDGTDVLVEVDRPDGPVPLGQAAAEWLASPKGDKLRPAPPPVEGPFLRLVRAMGSA